jgi:hypothetical protein
VNVVLRPYIYKDRNTTSGEDMGKRKTTEGRQEMLMPLTPGDQRLLQAGWAGDLSDTELVFIQERLRRSRRLSNQWRIGQECAEDAVRVIAMGAITELS